MSSAQQISTHIRSRVASGALRHLSVIDISAAVSFYGVSRNTVVSTFKGLSEVGYLEVTPKGGFAAFSWHEQDIEDQFRVGTEMLKIALQSIDERCSKNQKDGLCGTIAQLADDAASGDFDHDKLASNISHALSALTFLSPIARLHQAFMSFLPVGTQRIALAGVTQSTLLTVTDTLAEMTRRLSKSDVTGSAIAMVDACDQMRSSVVTRARLLSKYPAPPRIDLLELDDVDETSGIVAPIRSDLVNLDKWIASTELIGRLSKTAG